MRLVAFYNFLDTIVDLQLCTGCTCQIHDKRYRILENRNILLQYLCAGLNSFFCIKSDHF